MSRLRLGLSVALGVYWVAIFILTHLPPSNGTGGQVNDKLAHFVGYFILGTMFCALLILYRVPPWRAVGMTIIVGALYGAADELLQIPVGRTAEWGDWLADLIGAAAGALVGRLVFWKRDFSERDAMAEKRVADH